MCLLRIITCVFLNFQTSYTEYVEERRSQDPEGTQRMEGQSFEMSSWNHINGPRSRGRIYGTGDLASQFYHGATSYTVESRARTHATTDSHDSEESTRLREELETQRQQQEQLLSQVHLQQEKLDAQQQALETQQEEIRQIRLDARREIHEVHESFERRMGQFMREMAARDSRPSPSSMRMPPPTSRVRHPPQDDADYDPALDEEPLDDADPRPPRRHRGS